MIFDRQAKFSKRFKSQIAPKRTLPEENTAKDFCLAGKYNVQKTYLEVCVVPSSVLETVRTREKPLTASANEVAFTKIAASPSSG